MEPNCSISVSGTQTGNFSLIRQCLVGDDQAWEVVVRSITGRVFWLSYRFTHCREDAEDLTQEILIRVYRNLHQFHSNAGNLQSWVMAIARNLIIDRHRQIRNQPEKAGSDELEQLNVAEERWIDPLHAVEQAEASELVRYGLRRLPSYLRQAVRLKCVEEMEYPEIASRLRLSEGTVKSRVSRGRVRLARIVKSRTRKRSG